MLRSYTPADFFTLGNASCGTIAVFLCLNYIAEGSNRYVWIAFALGDGAAQQPTLTQTPAPLNATPIVLPEVPAKAILTRTCGSSCHGLESVTTFRRNRAGWSAMIDAMVSRGAALSAADRQIILDYVSEHAGN